MLRGLSPRQLSPPPMASPLGVGVRNTMDNCTSDDDRTTKSIIRYLNIHMNLFYLIFGNIGNLLKVAFFLQKPLRTLPCTVYILSATLSDFVTLNNLPALQLLTHLYPNHHWIKVTVDWSNHRNDSMLIYYTVSTYDIVICKVRSYLHMLSTDFYLRKKRQKNSFSINRIFSHFPYVHKLCFTSLIICALLSTHHLLNFTVQSTSKGCTPRYRILWISWILTIHCFLLPMLMIIFGLLTLNNLRHINLFCHCLDHYRERVKQKRFTQMCAYCTRCQNTFQHKIDKQLTGMIISEIVGYLRKYDDKK
ncbi:hypothetical protein I4U23_001188 [Adineta vaga]|nr:hypothetical protein I4U23_001188 [Adineta vaga]